MLGVRLTASNETNVSTAASSPAQETLSRASVVCVSFASLLSGIYISPYFVYNYIMFNIHDSFSRFNMKNKNLYKTGVYSLIS